MERIISYNGYGIEQSDTIGTSLCQTAVKGFETASAEGDAHAQTYPGEIYDYGKDIELS